jgi:hypothetical protein
MVKKAVISPAHPARRRSVSAIAAEAFMSIPGEAFFSVPLMTAVGAVAVELELVSLDGESVPGRDLGLQPLDFLVLELHDFPAAGTDQVIVVPLVRDVVVLRLGAEMTGLGQPRFAKKIQRAVDGRQSDMRVLFGQHAVHLLGGDVLILKKRLENVFALTGQLELVLGEVVLEDVDLLGRLGHVRPDRHAGIKNQLMKDSQAGERWH